jgi:hypothetical protein
MKVTQLFVGCALAFSTLASPSFSQTHEDNRLGFEVRTPKEWNVIPPQTKEEWIVAKYLCNREDFYTDRDLGYTFQQRPQMRVIAFLSDKYREDQVKIEKDKDGKIKSFIVRWSNPYKNYKAFLKGTLNEGGFYFAEEEQTTIDGMTVDQYVVKIEKGSQGPKRMITWVFHGQDVDFAVEFLCFESAWKKHKSTVQKSLKSFKEIPRTEGSVGGNAVTGEEFRTDFDEMDADEMREYRKAKEGSAHKAAVKGLPDDWEVVDKGRFLVLNHGNDKALKRAVEQGNAIFSWCERNLGYIGPDAYVPRPVIRICRDITEEQAFRTGSDWFRPGIEITTHKDNVGVGSYEYRWLNQRFLGYWIMQRDSDLANAMPGWMSYGLRNVFEYSKTKGKKLEFRPSDWEHMGLREKIKDNSAHTPKEIFLATEEDYREENFGYEAAALMRYLLVGKGSKDRLTKSLLKDYHTNLMEVVLAIEEEGSPKRKEATTEEEENEQFKNQSQFWKNRRKRITDETFEMTFSGWSDKDWSTLTKLYFKSIK